ncbi:IclR family transcriptional regulator domain-containing protein [Jiella pelagia]|uniref:Helix-turn-helix domain-containing protein n=1 Tax=Jiella pelagia TaxID=2986949 RepID=A0ABY7C677_9HYPH|nr:IclR family transcriptional regulator C-terminal domain-containing protein [Jiella pelagia]WAP70345.1 helix-turn-helix domain-containing protein [Jiella pelagia]
MVEGRDGNFVEGLARGLSILESFDRNNASMTLSQVARRTGMSPAAARRGLHTLASLGYIRQVDRNFVLSARILTLASAYLQAAGSDDLLLPELRRIVGTFGAAASIAVLHGTDILYVAHYSEERSRRIVASVGTHYPAHATSMGKVLIAALGAEQLDAYLEHADFRPLTDRTIDNADDLKRVIAECRKNGYATAVDELDYGITSLAVPIRNAQGRVLAAINCSGYSGRVTAERLVAERLEDLIGSANRIGRILDANPALAQSFHL